MRREPTRRKKLLELSDQLRDRLIGEGFDTGNGSSQIIPVVLRHTESTMEFARIVRQQGYFVPPIRPPSVPFNESMLRISLTARHGQDEIDGMVEAMKECAGQFSTMRNSL